MSPSTPAAGAGTSMVTLSVSSSTSGSSTATGSPGCLNHLPMVASVTDSPKVGTRISAMVFVPRWSRPRAALLVEHDLFRKPASTFRDHALRQRLVEQRLELLQMQRHLADRGRRRGGAPGIGRLLALGANLVEHPFEIRIEERVRAHVARLLLAPHELRLGEAAELP